MSFRNRNIEAERRWLDREGTQIALAAVVPVLVVLFGVFFVFLQAGDEMESVSSDRGAGEVIPLRVSPPPADMVRDVPLGEAADAVVAAAATLGYDAEIRPWVPQLMFEDEGRHCQLPFGRVDLEDLATLTSEAAMVRVSRGPVEGHVEILGMGNATTAMEVGAAVEGLIESRPECATGRLSDRLDDARGGSIQVVSTVGGDRVYVVTVASQRAAVSEYVIVEWLAAAVFGPDA